MPYSSYSVYVIFELGLLKIGGRNAEICGYQSIMTYVSHYQYPGYIPAEAKDDIEYLLQKLNQEYSK